MSITKEAIREFVEVNPTLVSRKETSVPGVYLLKYKNRVFYDNLWNEVLQECRGTLVDEDYNVVSRPFTKIFNHGENGTTIPKDERCTTFKKINGFMAAITVHKGKLLISTTGSTDSTFAVMAQDIILEQCNTVEILKHVQKYKTTFIVEICTPDDPHIINELSGVYLLGERKNKWDSTQNLCVNPNYFYEYLADYFGMYSCSRDKVKFGDLCETVKNVKHEGFVVYGDVSGISLKIKSPYYLMAKFLARKSPEKIINLIDNPHEIKKIVAEEYYPLVDHICYIRDRYVSSSEQERLEIIREFIYND